MGKAHASPPKNHPSLPSLHPSSLSIFDTTGLMPSVQHVMNMFSYLPDGKEAQTKVLLIASVIVAFLGPVWSVTSVLIV